MNEPVFKFLFALNEAFGRSEKTKYTEEMASFIVRHFRAYTPENLNRILELVIKEWAGEYGPPNLSVIIKMVDTYNDRVARDDGIWPGLNVPQIPLSTEDCLPKGKVKRMFGVMSEVLKIRDRDQRKKAFQEIRDKILNGREETENENSD